MGEAGCGESPFVGHNASSLLKHALQEYGTTKSSEAVGIEVRTVSEGTARAEILHEKDTALGTVVENRVLTSPNAPAKRHIGEFRHKCRANSNLSEHRVRLARGDDIQGWRLPRYVSFRTSPSKHRYLPSWTACLSTPSGSCAGRSRASACLLSRR